MNILHVSSVIGKSSGGLGPVAAGLASVQKDIGCNPAIWCVDRPDEVNFVEREWGLYGRVIPFRTLGPRKFCYSPSAELSAASSAGAGFDILHQHGIWTPFSRITRCWRRAHLRPTIVATHGTLEPWALARSALKKRLALTFYERDNLAKADCLQATAMAEADSIRRFGLSNPIAILPNGVSDSWLASHGDRARFRRDYNLDERRIMLFLSRVHPIKGLPLLLQAVSELRALLRDWSLIIAGEDEVGHQAELQTLISDLAIESMVKFVGPLHGQAKRDAFSAAELFVLPTHSENFGIVVAEALATGVPVITTRGAPWQCLTEWECGWWVDVSAGGLIRAMAEAIATDSVKLREMSDRGRALVNTHFTWSAIGLKSLKLYRWLLGRETRPDFVLTVR